MALDFISIDSVNDISSDIIVFCCNDQFTGEALKHFPDSVRVSLTHSKIFTAKQGQHLWLTDEQWPNTQLLCMGTGKNGIEDAEQFNKISKNAYDLCQQSGLENATVLMANELKQSLRIDSCVQASIALAQHQYRFDIYKEERKETNAVNLHMAFLSPLDDAQKMRLDQGLAMAHGVLFARDLANQPGNVCTPDYLAQQAQSIADSSDAAKCTILNEAEIHNLGMGAFYSVAKGSSENANLVIIEYNNAGDSAPVALVGKGITFDTGGISLKPGAKMDEMKFDMCGAASVLGTAQAIIAMQLPINAIFAIAAAENMPNGNASKPGDIVTAYNGKTIEVLNTDAEGRLVLCDTLSYVEEQYQPSTMIDIATLTGACIVALGHHTSAVMSYDDALANTLMECGINIDDQCWQLPLGKAYKAQLKSEFADLGNIGGPAAGTVTAGCFLGEFVDTEKTAWAHLDIAGTAWSGKAATGRPVPLLCQFMITQSQR